MVVSGGKPCACPATPATHPWDAPPPPPPTPATHPWDAPPPTPWTPRHPCHPPLSYLAIGACMHAHLQVSRLTGSLLPCPALPPVPTLLPCCPPSQRSCPAAPRPNAPALPYCPPSQRSCPAVPRPNSLALPCCPPSQLSRADGYFTGDCYTYQPADNGEPPIHPSMVNNSHPSIHGD